MNNIVRLQKAMREQGCDLVIVDVTTQGYSQDYLEAVGPAGEGSYVPLGHALLEEADQIPALEEYVTWLEKTAPDEDPTSNGLQAWIRAQMFFEAAMEVGPELTREALIDELTSMTDFDAGGLIPPIDVGNPVPKQACFVLAQVQDGKYVRVFPEEGFHCSADDLYHVRVRLSELLAFTIVGVVTGSIYAVAASGLVVTYTTSGVFNIAHGAVGMLMAFLYWQVRFDWGWPTPLSLLFVLGVAAPLLGASSSAPSPATWGRHRLFEPRGHHRAPAGAHGGRAEHVAPGGPPRRRVLLARRVRPRSRVRHLAPDDDRAGGGRGGGGPAPAMFRTRAGVTMRAVVDHRNLAALTGARPALSSSLSWALGSSLAALAGILLAPVLQLNVQALTLLVVNAYAAAMVGRLRSVPLTFVGAVCSG